MTNHPFLTLVFIGAMLWSVENKAKTSDLIGKEQQLIHTLKPGSPEREAICDGARRYVLSEYVSVALPQAIIFKINHLSVQEPYCSLEAFPLFKDGSDMSTEYIDDIAFNFCMKETAGTWQVIVDLSRTDVPDSSELRQIRRDFPKDFPLSLMSPFWRQRLQRTSGSQVSGSQGANDAEMERAAPVRVAAQEADWAAQGISQDFVTASKMAKHGATAKEINEAIALDHRKQPNRPQMHPAERAELARNYGIQIDRL